eukprot:7975532-Pyramimonas_sp.AAC.1
MFFKLKESASLSSNVAQSAPSAPDPRPATVELKNPNPMGEGKSKASRTTTDQQAAQTGVKGQSMDIDTSGPPAKGRKVFAHMGG